MRQLLGLCLIFSIYFCDSSDIMTMLIDQKEIDKKIQCLAKEISQEYNGKRLVVMSVLKGAIFISADIMSHLKIPYEIEFVRCSSYSEGIHRSKLCLRFLNEINIKDKHLLVIDDIFDTGNTMLAIVDEIKKKGPASIKTLTLLQKNVQRETQYYPDYVLFEIENQFVIGYGLDYREHYRGLKGIWILHPPYHIPFEN